MAHNFTPADRAKAIQRKRMRVTQMRSLELQQTEQGPFKALVNNMMHLQCPGKAEGITYAHAIVEALMDRAAAGHLQAAQLLIERVEGKPIQATVEKRERMVLSETVVSQPASSNVSVERGASSSLVSESNGNVLAPPARSLPITTVPVNTPIPPNRGDGCSEDPLPESHAAPSISDPIDSKGDKV